MPKRSLSPAGWEGGRVGGVVAEPLPPQTRACATDALGSSPDSFAHDGVHERTIFVDHAPCDAVRDPQVEERPRSGCSLACSAIHCCFVYVFLELSVSSIVSHQWFCTGDAPLPSGGSRWPRFPAFKGTIRTLRLPAPACPSAHCFRQPAPQAPAGFVSAIGAPAAVQARRRAGVWIVLAGTPLSSVPARGQAQDLPGSLAIHPVTLRRSTTPDDPLRLACSGASGTAPTRLTMKASSIYRFRGCTPLRHLLSTLHDGRCRTPCKTRFRLAGCAFAGRESNPLDRDERFQFMASSFPGLGLAQ